MRIAAVALFLLTIALQPAGAVSFDCGKATTWVEKAICADPGLSEADDHLAGAFRRAMAELSPEGQESLRSDQRRWIRYLEACGTAGKGSADNWTLGCLRGAYSDRIRDLGQAVQRLGSFTFLRQETYRAQRVEQGGQPDLATFHMQRVRIDQPTTPETGRWNKLVARPVNPVYGCGGEAGEYHDATVVRGASRTTVTVEVYGYIHCRGMPHGQSGSRIETWILSQSLAF